MKIFIFIFLFSIIYNKSKHFWTKKKRKLRKGTTGEDLLIHTLMGVMLGTYSGNEKWQSWNKIFKKQKHKLESYIDMEVK